MKRYGKKRKIYSSISFQNSPGKIAAKFSHNLTQIHAMAINNVLPSLERTINRLKAEFTEIPDDRKSILRDLTKFIKEKQNAGKNVSLNFICTHNSRRSHIAQIWAQAAAHYYSVGNVTTFSGGTEATAFNPRAVNAMKQAGFDISIIKDGKNPVYNVMFSQDTPPLTIFSKKYDDESNPKKDFAAIMTCSHADENCPFIPGATIRIALTYNDPKDFDGTPQEAEMYSQRVQEIGREILYAFSQVK
jgi:arsenate reductase